MVITKLSEQLTVGDDKLRFCSSTKEVKKYAKNKHSFYLVETMIIFFQDVLATLYYTFMTMILTLSINKC